MKKSIPIKIVIDMLIHMRFIMSVHKAELLKKSARHHPFNVKSVFLAGVVTGGIMNKVYIEDGRFHGLKIAEEIEQCLI